MSHNLKTNFILTNRQFMKNERCRQFCRLKIRLDVHFRNVPLNFSGYVDLVLTLRFDSLGKIRTRTTLLENCELVSEECHELHGPIRITARQIEQGVLDSIFGHRIEDG
ncbi:hypothetical protein BLNAU_12879 [Blattamonas nauphoetae]|uniref:Uncharacterized protein n=1 Tax=Blattamonas nauphoetae TaxID=2049346 RepID=A0ABQ9XIC0_9EUKA|nr:hypothetical protein BLNAU_12876 [Blattamonas nauphoetae]KAK2952176.1 hypothetical protein BLNAU_12879 [Blattamonas nauphoetae]